MDQPVNRFTEYLADYDSFHQTRGNQITHFIGIPLLTVTIYGLMSHVKIAVGLENMEGQLPLDAGLVGWIVATIWYLTLDWRIAIPTSLITLACYGLGLLVPLPYLIASFVIGWAIQYVGHLGYEKNKPAFYKNFEHLMIGPAWTFGKIFGYMPPLTHKPPVRARAV